MTEKLINNTKWLAGHAAFERGDGCPWTEADGDESCRLGWLAARDEKRCRAGES